MLNTAISIIEAFQKAGFVAYFAGGSVRDMLMEIEPEDYDIATSATPDEIEHVLQNLLEKEAKIIPIGRQFGVMLGLVEGHEFEIATFRSDSSSSDGRRPDAVLFTDAKQDAVRRDFTINGLFYDPLQKKVHDFVEGQKDIQKKIIRFIGEPHERIKEDHLRILRAIRFKNTLGFKYAPGTEAALADLAHLIEGVSMERIQAEVTKMLLSKNRSHALKELDELGLLEKILPEITACKGVKQPLQYHGEGDVYTHLLKAVHDIPEKWVSKELVWATLLHDIGKPGTYEQKADRIHFDGHAELSAQMAKQILKRFKFSKAEINKITWMIDHHMTIGFIPEMRRAHQAALFWHPWFEDLMKLHYCDEHGSHPPDLSLYETVMKLYHELKDQKLLGELKVFFDGKDLQKDFGLKPGPQIKEVLEALKMAQIEEVVQNKEEARRFVEGYLGNRG